MWEDLNVEDLFARREAQNEEVTTANVGYFARPFGGVIRQPVPANIALPQLPGGDECRYPEDCSQWSDYDASMWGR